MILGCFTHLFSVPCFLVKETFFKWRLHIILEIFVIDWLQRKRFIIRLIQPERAVRAQRCHLGIVLLRTWF